MSNASDVSIAQLLLFPVNEPLHPHDLDLLGVLQKLGFAGEPIDAPRRYLIGEHFLSQVSFLGCSPAIELSPDASHARTALTDFTHIYLSPVFDAPRFVYDPQQARPICLHCGARINDWSQYREQDMLACPQCGHRARLDEYRWRRSAARAIVFVSVLNVFAREAIPTDGLLTQLGDETGVGWDYAYCNCPLIG